MTAPHTDTFFLLGSLLRFHARASRNGGAYSLVEALTAPGAGAPPHRHTSDDEAFYVLEGSFEFLLNDKIIAASKGSFVRVPLGTVHAFKNVGETPGRMLIINAPGHVHENFFSQAGEPMPEGTRDLPAPTGTAPDILHVLEVGLRSGLEFLPPVAAAG